MLKPPSGIHRCLVEQRLFAVYNTLTQRLYQTEHIASLPPWQVIFAHFPKLSNSTFIPFSSFVRSTFLPKTVLAFFGTVSQCRMFSYSFSFISTSSWTIPHYLYLLFCFIFTPSWVFQKVYYISSITSRRQSPSPRPYLQTRQVSTAKFFWSFF
jgi:hypothetical protein